MCFDPGSAGLALIPLLQICLGISTTQLLHNLSTALKFEPGDELVLSKLNHEANTAAWVRIAGRLGLQVKWWSASDTRNPDCDLDELVQLLSERTRLVACPHASNITGTITNVKEIAKLVHQYPRVGLDGGSFCRVLICFRLSYAWTGLRLHPIVR